MHLLPKQKNGLSEKLRGEGRAGLLPPTLTICGFKLHLKMQFHLVNNKEMLVFLCIWVHDGVVCLAVSGLRHTCSGSCRSRGLSVAAIWNHVEKRIVWPLLFL